MMRTTVLLVAVVCLAEGFTFTLPARDYKCFHEELPHDYEFSGKWSATSGYTQFIDVRITNPQGTVIHELKGKDGGDYALTTTSAGDHTICFYNRMIQGSVYSPTLSRDITFDLFEGAKSHDYEQIAKVEHLKPIEVNLRMMEDTVRAIHAEYQYFKEREHDMRDTSEVWEGKKKKKKKLQSTNSRAMWITITSMTSFFLFGLWQVSHMKKYFREKKLI